MLPKPIQSYSNNEWYTGKTLPKREVVYVTIGNPAFCLAVYLTGVYFRDELQHIPDVSEPNKSIVDQSSSS